MSTNRLFYVLIVIALLSVGTLTSWEAFATNKVVADRSYDQVEQVRSGIQANRSYDSIEQMRLGLADDSVTNDLSYDRIEQLRSERAVNTLIANRSYDAIENLRSQRNKQ